MRRVAARDNSRFATLAQTINRTATTTALSSVVTSVAAGHTHTCSLGGGGLNCWGANQFGQLGDGTTIARELPQSITNPGFVELASGDEFTCGRTALGNVYCWGDNRSGQLGLGTMTRSLVPIDVVLP